MPTPKHWLMKSEPETYSIDDLARDRKTSWDSIRNYQARNFMQKDMQKGDWVLFYHSNSDPAGVAGLAQVVKAAYPDATSWDRKSPYFDPKSTPENPRWFMVDVAFVEKFKHFVTLAKIKQEMPLKEMLVIRRGMRLSVQPVTAAEFKIIQTLGNTP